MSFDSELDKITAIIEAMTDEERAAMKAILEEIERVENEREAQT